MPDQDDTTDDALRRLVRALFARTDTENDADDTNDKPDKPTLFAQLTEGES